MVIFHSETDYLSLDFNWQAAHGRYGPGGNTIVHIFDNERKYNKYKNTIEKLRKMQLTSKHHY